MRAHGPTLLRLGCLGTLLTVAYALALWQPLRGWYSDMDKLAHAVAFAAVYGGLCWALRAWPLWALAALAAALGAAVEVHQVFLPGFSPSRADWMADLAGIGLAASLHAGGHWINARLRRPGTAAKAHSHSPPDKELLPRDPFLPDPTRIR